MSTAPPPGTNSPGPSAPVTKRSEVRIISHSPLFYWWPVWFFGLLFSLITYFSGSRMVIVPNDSVIKIDKDAQGRPSPDGAVVEVGKGANRLIQDSVESNGQLKPKARVSTLSWMGPVYAVILFLVILITNVPLRGLWSLIIVITLILIAVTFSLFDWWDDIIGKFADLHIYQNMAGYLFLSVMLAIAWFISVFIFDQRAYMIVTPGQIKVCEEIGDREKVYDTTGLSIEKQRVDWFRHILLGFGTGDLIVKTAGADRHEIKMPNVTFIDWKIPDVQHLARERPVT